MSYRQLGGLRRRGTGFEAGDRHLVNQNWGVGPPIGPARNARLGARRRTGAPSTPRSRHRADKANKTEGRSRSRRRGEPDGAPRTSAAKLEAALPANSPMLEILRSGFTGNSGGVGRPGRAPRRRRSGRSVRRARRLDRRVQLHRERELSWRGTGPHEDVDAPGADPLRGLGRQDGAHWPHRARAARARMSVHVVHPGE